MLSVGLSMYVYEICMRESVICEIRTAQERFEVQSFKSAQTLGSIMLESPISRFRRGQSLVATMDNQTMYIVPGRLPGRRHLEEVEYTHTPHLHTLTHTLTYAHVGAI